MSQIKFMSGENIPLEMHKVRIVQKLCLPTVEQRQKNMEAAGNNTFLLQNKDVFIDMLTDSGVNAMSDNQQAAMLQADDAYAGSATFTRLEGKLRELFGMDYYLPTHQGRAAENILAETYVKPGTVIPMNYHFTTTKAHITRLGGRVEELICDEGLESFNDYPFKGNFNVDKLRALIESEGVEKTPFVRLEAGTNLIGGQPLSLRNIKDVCAVCREYGILTVLDASLLQDNLYFIKQREEACKDMTIRQITREIADQMDILYFSARKLGFARGGGICIRSEAECLKMKELIPVYEGFLTYGGMSVREMEAVTVGLEETMDEDVISQGPQFIRYMVDELHAAGVPVITPAGGLGCHIDVKQFLPHVPQEQYSAGALAAALYIAGGIRGMERGTMSEQREPDGSEHLAAMELVRLAVPRRVYTLSQVKYVIDRVKWLYENREIVGGLKFIEEPAVLRFFFGRLAPVSDWQEKLVAKFRADFGESL
ncbi:tryptophanase [Oscillibacter hominis]|uniref:Tryptophanase n=1 Tax=Oscillibacter hominis TaxID=2763056 RepID=A0A7G9B280_9FIRM|nr:tryptophanase [Oscillibacter hominis]QNL43661.1 tryptophanase [Oscillibacter hominis]